MFLNKRMYFLVTTIYPDPTILRWSSGSPWVYGNQTEEMVRYHGKIPIKSQILPTTSGTVTFQ